MVLLAHISLKKDKMIFQIKPYIDSPDEQLHLMISEIKQMTMSEIQDGIESCRLAIEGEEGLSWGLEVFEILLSKELSTLEYHSSFITEIPTKDILQMLIDYRNALVHFDDNSAV